MWLKKNKVLSTENLWAHTVLACMNATVVQLGHAQRHFPHELSNASGVPLTTLCPRGRGRLHLHTGDTGMQEHITATRWRGKGEKTDKQRCCLPSIISVEGVACC